MKHRPALMLSLCVAALLVTLLTAPYVGAGDLSLLRAWRGDSPDREILWDLRLSRALLAMLSGGGLALAGCLFQAMLQNVLATPYTMGVSSGAALGAVAAICAGWSTWHGIPLIWLCALAGAGLVLFGVLGMAVKSERISAVTLLLMGVCANSICSAFILLLHSFAGFTQSFSITRWLIGGMDSIEFAVLGWLALAVVPTSLLIVGQSRQWNLLMVGEQWAATRGVDVRRLMLTGYLTGSVLTASITAITGPIGFVGLIVPHLIRQRIGGDHRVLMPASFLLGAVFLCWCDTIGRTAMAPADIPAGVITALVGGPFLAWLIRSKQTRGIF